MKLSANRYDKKTHHTDVGEENFYCPSISEQSTSSHLPFFKLLISYHKAAMMQVPHKVWLKMR